ncbi:MAG: ATP-dependent Clp protease ATP-binding subunit ClpA, partial [Epsilonproteobacteria bacterium]|nr:ATP-dependent Clp protease ATP-binding subunit ClpA [Campylobacterota bacterium]
EFEPLDLDSLVKIVGIEIDRLNATLDPKNIKLTITPKAKEYIANKGYDIRYGARHIARVIDELIKEKLSDEILFGRLKDGGRVKIGFEKNSLIFVVL